MNDKKQKKKKLNITSERGESQTENTANITFQWAVQNLLFQT